MTTRPTQPTSTVLSLPPPPIGARYGELLEKLLNAGVRPPTSSKVGRAWSKKEFSYAVGFNGQEAKQLRRYCGGDELPPASRSAKIDEALFGSDPRHYAAWRAALKAALEREDSHLQKPAATDATSYDCAESSSAHVPLHSSVDLRVPLYFHGRSDDIEAIQALLTTPPRRVAIHGLNGVGKSMLAAAYAQQYGSAYRMIAWIDAETAEGCQVGLVNFGRRLGCVDPNDSDQEALAKTLAYLAVQGEHLLVIYDNAGTSRAIYSYLPGGDICQILITSNSPNWLAEAIPYELTGWPPDVGAEFLSRRLGLIGDRRDAHALSIELGGLPIALELAATICERRSISLTEFNRKFSSSPTLYLSQPDLSPPAYTMSVANAFTLAIQAATEEHAAARPLLEFMCALAHDPVPLFLIDESRDLFEQSISQLLVADGVDEALAALRNYSLITDLTYNHGSTRQDGGECIAMHLLVRHLVNRDIGLQDARAQQAVAAIARSYPLAVVPAGSSREFILVPHIEHILTLRGQVRDDLLNPSVERLVAHRANVLLQLAKGNAFDALSDARAAFDLALAIDHPVKDDVISASARILYAMLEMFDHAEEATDLWVEYILPGQLSRMPITELAEFLTSQEHPLEHP